MLVDPERHEPLIADAWDETAARNWIARYADHAQTTFSRAQLWPVHPLDVEEGDRGAGHPMIDVGAAGVIWALDKLARAGATGPLADFAPVVDELEARNTALVEPRGHGVEGLLAGRSGILLLRYRLASDRATVDAAAASIAESIANNAGHPSLELLWGSPSTMHAALTMHEWTGETRWAELFRADADALMRAFLPANEAPCRIWTQDVERRKPKYIGAAHGFAGNASALIRGRALLPEEKWAQWADGIVETAHATVLRDGPLANWPPELQPSGTPTKMLVQWCHGAPGMVTSLARLPDPRLDALLAAAGELTWVAGPLTKGAGLCHGTAGNGYAFLKLYRRTGDARWLNRAKGFAMHAMAQSDRMAEHHGRRRHSLFTGDPGVAWYVWSCITGDDAFPILDPAQ
jgi:Lanthionine synthetase C-like protein